MDGSSGKIVVSRDGPYVVTGRIPLSIQTIIAAKNGDSLEWSQGRVFETRFVYKLCRCGHSSRKPFCDDTHLKIRFDGKETATRAAQAEQAKTYDGPTLTLGDAKELCASARFCHPGGQIWSLVERSEDPEARELAIREARYCPSGRLVLYDKKKGEGTESPLPPSIAVVEDPAIECSGPLWVRGGIRVESEDGTPYERRNRVTLCRCGRSENKPFCDGSHVDVKFTDGLT